MTKPTKIKTTIHEIAFENQYGEYLDAEFHIEGFIELNLETSGKFTISSVEELTDIYNKLKNILEQK